MLISKTTAITAAEEEKLGKVFASDNMEWKDTFCAKCGGEMAALAWNNPDDFENAGMYYVCASDGCDGEIQVGADNQELLKRWMTYHIRIASIKAARSLVDVVRLNGGWNGLPRGVRKVLSGVVEDAIHIGFSGIDERMECFEEASKKEDK